MTLGRRTVGARPEPDARHARSRADAEHGEQDVKTRTANGDVTGTIGSRRRGSGEERARAAGRRARSSSASARSNDPEDQQRHRAVVRPDGARTARRRGAVAATDAEVGSDDAKPVTARRWWRPEPPMSPADDDLEAATTQERRSTRARPRQHVGQVRRARLLPGTPSWCGWSARCPPCASVRDELPARVYRRAVATAASGRPAPRPAAARTDRCHAASSAGPRIDRAPRPPSRSPVTTNCPSPDDEREVIGRGPGVATTRSGTSPASIASPSASSRPRTAGAARHPDRRAPRSPSCSASDLRAGRVVGLGVGQRDRHDPPAALGGHLERPIERRARRVARVDEHEPLPPDEVRIDRLAGHAAAGRHLDPDRRRRRRPRPRPRRADRAPAAPDLVDRLTCAQLLSVVEVGSHMPSRPPPSPRAPRAADARRAPRPRRRPASPRRPRAAPRRRTGRRSDGHGSAA